MKLHSKVVTTLSIVATTLSLIAPVAVSAASTSTIPQNVSSTSSDWASVDKWTPDQIASFLNDSTNSENSISTGTAPTGDQLTNELNQYVSVRNNQFVLTIPSGLNISSEKIQRANAEIIASNSLIKKFGLTIDTKTGVASESLSLYVNPIQSRIYGKNGILAIGWNYIRVGLDRGLVKDILSVGWGILGGGSALLAKKIGIPGKYATEIAGIVGAAIGAVLGNHVKAEAVWFDFNTFTYTVSAFGYQ